MSVATENVNYQVYFFNKLSACLEIVMVFFYFKQHNSSDNLHSITRFVYVPSFIQMGHIFVDTVSNSSQIQGVQKYSLCYTSKRLV